MEPRRHLQRLLFPHGRFRVRVLLVMLRHHWFIRLRWLMAAAAVGLLIVDRIHEPSFARPAQLVACIAVLAAVNVVWTLLASRFLRELHAADHLSAGQLRSMVGFTNAQMIVDLLLLTALLRYTGGIENPMSVFYLFHMMIAALLLRPLNALLQGAWAILLYAGLGFGECLGWIAPHYPFMASTAEVLLHEDWVYVLAGIGVLAAGVVGALYFTLQISSRLDEQEHELFEANQALELSRDAIQHLQERRSRFMRTAAHQLKNPLTGIEMLAGLIRDRLVAEGRLDQIANRIIKRCQEGVTQVTELLTLERVEQATPGRHTSATTDVVEVIRRVVARFRQQARVHHIDLHLDLGDCMSARAAVDPQDLEDCVANLVDNAIKYTPDGGAVEVSTTCGVSEVRISVKDTGMGIAPETMETLFEPFRRGNAALAANIPGSGLGLSIVHEVVTQAGGRIAVHSERESGAEFVVTLPRAGNVGAGRSTAH